MPPLAPFGARQPSHRRRRQGAFTLLEVLVAFVIIAMTATVALRSSSLSIDAASKSADATRAALHARSLLSEAGVNRPLRASEITGRMDETTSWTLRVSKLSSPTPLLDHHAITVSVTVGQARVVLETHRLAPAERKP
jgi:general secretion pathway protein I